MFPWMCECRSSSCRNLVAYDKEEIMKESNKCVVEIPLQLAQRLMRGDERLYLIADMCEVGPSPGDELVETGPKYKLYRENA